MEATYKLTRLLKESRNCLQSIVGGRHRLRAVPHSSRGADQSVEQSGISRPLNNLFKLIWGRPAAVFIVVKLFLQGIHLKAHVESQPGNTAVIVTTCAIERLSQGENRASARQKINPTHNRKS
jgi:hypothetical protein